MTTTHTVRVPGATIHYEVRGSGPALVAAGSPMASQYFAPLAQALADSFTVITYDPRGIGRSTIDDPTQESTPDLRADDVLAVLDAVGAERADFFGSSGGAVTGLALATRYPDRVRTLVAHEPPLLAILPDAAEQLAGTDEIIATYHRHGLGAAFGAFMAQAGFPDDEPGPDAHDPAAPDGPPQEPSEQDLFEGGRFFTSELKATVTYRPDVTALTSGAVRVIPGIGVDSGHLLTQRTTAALAALLGLDMVEFPGDHGGFLPEPAAFADVLRTVLAPSRV
ncbi:MAG TPA: alpha/beta hydrolase [Nakamurella sp.]